MTNFHISNYKKIINQINTYLQLEDIELTNDYISAYDLYNILNETLKPLREMINNKTLQAKINKDRTIIKKISNYFKNNKHQIKKKCLGIYYQTENLTSKLTFIFEDNNIPLDNILSIYKDFDSDEIYFGQFNSDREFITTYYEDINKYFNTLEKFYYILQSDINYTTKNIQYYTDEYFIITITYDNIGRVDIDISITPSLDKENIYNREWQNLNKISDIVKEKKQEFLKKIPLKIEELNPTCQQIIKPHIPKISTLTKKNEK